VNVSEPVRNSSNLECSRPGLPEVGGLDRRSDPIGCICRKSCTKSPATIDLVCWRSNGRQTQHRVSEKVCEAFTVVFSTSLPSFKALYDFLKAPGQVFRVKTNLEKRLGPFESFTLGRLLSDRLSVSQACRFSSDVRQTQSNSRQKTELFQFSRTRSQTRVKFGSSQGLTPS
jgi:hypothetical protein